MFDAVVVGAGVCGSYAANKLAKLGHRVLVLEKKAQAGFDVCCTGIIGQECLDLLQPDPKIIFSSSQSANFIFPSGRQLLLKRPEPVAYVLDRSKLDQSLWTQALNSGAEYRFDCPVSQVQQNADGLTITAIHRGQSLGIQSRSLIIATGYSSTLPSKMGLGTIPDRLIGAQAEVELRENSGVEVYIDQQVTPGGFAWLVPTSEGRALIGLVTRKQHPKRLELLLERLQKQGKIAADSCCLVSGAIPIRARSKTYGNRLLAIGDAAGQVKPTTGGGIYYGLLSADIAVSVLHRGFEHNQLAASHLATYQRQWKKRLRKEMSIGYAAHRLWATLSNETIEGLLELALLKGLPDIVQHSEHFSFDWHAPLLSHLSRQLPNVRSITYPTTPTRPPPHDFAGKM